MTLWSDLGSTWIFDTGAGRDVLGGAVKRDDSANDTLYFKFHLDPQSDSTTEEYFAAFELYEGDAERVGIGNAFKAWAYSAFFKQDAPEEAGQASSYLDLHSSVLEPSGAGTSPSYELPRRGVERTIVFKVQYVAGGEDLVTVWLNPDLSSGANEIYQAESLTTLFNANAAFDELRLRHGGGGGGWIFSELAIATSFNDFVDSSSAKPLGAMPHSGFIPQRFKFQSWQRESGMPRSAIRALAQTVDGYLWLGSDEGLARFDGVRFVAIDLPKIASAGDVRTLLGDSQGALWIGTATNGLVRFCDRAMVGFTTDNGLPANSVTALAEDGSGRVWIGTSSGLSAWERGRVSAIPGAESLRGQNITALCRDASGRMWVGVANRGIFCFEAGVLTALAGSEADPLLGESHCLLVDRSGRIWVGAGDDLLLCRENGQWRRFRIPRQAASAFISTLAEAADGTVWAGSIREGLFQLKEGKLAAVNAGAGLLDNQITALFVDRDGKLWIGSDSGLSRLPRTRIFAIGQGEGLGYAAVHGLAEVAPNVVWAIKPHDGIYRWEGRSFRRLTAAGLLPRDPKLGALLVSRNGSCWVAGSGGLWLFRDPQAVADESRLFELTNASITALAEDLEGAIWAGSREGDLWRLARGQWEHRLHLASHGITALVPEPDGSIWVGTGGAGLFHCRPSHQEHFNKSHGLLSEFIRTLYRDSQGTLWIGTDGGGLARWQNGRIRSFTSQHGLQDNNISQILEDTAGRLWLGGDRGIACLNKQWLSGLAPPKIGSVFPSGFGPAEQTPSEQCSTGIFPSGLHTKSGLLWFSTVKGILVADPQHLPTNRATPAVILENVLVDGTAVGEFKPFVNASREGAGAIGRPIRIAPGKHRIELQYTIPDFDAPEQLRFRYQLEGLDAEWVDAGPRRAAFYNYVPPGEYRFRLATGNGTGGWNESDVGLTFTVSRYFWQRWWVLLLAVIGLLAAVVSGVRFLEKYRSRRRFKRLEQESALERERRRIAQDLHDEMGAKLCRISFLSEHAQRYDQAQGEIRDQITNIADASRELLHSLDEIVWAVNPHNDTLEHVASYINQYAQNYFHSTGIECELDMPDQFAPHPVASQARHHLFLAVHEAFTNILKHSGATRARLTMACSGSRFEIRVEDNGRGFTFPAVPAAHPEGNNSEDGLRNMRDRLESIGGECQLQSTPGQGTTLRFTLPLHPHKEKAIL